MLLTLEIATGVLLALLAYRGIDAYCTNRNITLTAAILLNLYRLLRWAVVFILVAGIGYGLFDIFSHPEWLNHYAFPVLLIIAVAAFVWSLRSDIRHGRKYKAIAAKTSCDGCGEFRLRFTGFKEGYKAKSGEEYDHPKAKCSGCGHEQMLTRELADLPASLNN